MTKKFVENIIREFDLTPHPEGGYYSEIYCDLPGDGSRGAVMVIYFLLKARENSAWHRIDAIET